MRQRRIAGGAPFPGHGGESARLPRISPGRRRGARLAGWIALGCFLLAAAGPAPAQDAAQRELALALARVMLDSAARRSIEEPLIAGMMQGVGAALQERLNRRLQDAEWQMVADIVRRFVGQTLAPDRAEEIAAEVYARHFDADELRDLLAFQRSALGRKTARLAPVIAVETAQAMDRAIRSSPALPEMLAQLRHVFPVLGAAESP